jgi:hypothetical protein
MKAVFKRLKAIVRSRKENKNRQMRIQIILNSKRPLILKRWVVSCLSLNVKAKRFARNRSFRMAKTILNRLRANIKRE